MSLWKRFRFALSAALKDPELHAVRPYPKFDAEACAAAFVRNHSLMQSYLRGIGIPAASFLQPSLQVGEREVHPAERMMTRHLERRIDITGCSQLDAHRRFQTAVARRLPSHPETSLIDLTDVLDDMKGVVYLDQVHLADAGIDRVAQRMAATALTLDTERP